jgi:REP element-mobilizing transposase RayT
VNGEWLFDEPAREVLRRQLWLVAEYCGLEILTYAILSNHFHVLVRVPRRVSVPDQELLRRYRLLYPKPTRHQAARLEVIQQQLLTDGPEAQRWRSAISKLNSIPPEHEHPEELRTCAI